MHLQHSYISYIFISTKIYKKYTTYGMRDFGKLLVLLYSTPRLPTATNQFCLVYLI